jgi:hypothetical protein
MQVVNQLIKYNKDFELLEIPGAATVPATRTAITSGMISSRGMLNVTPPAWKAIEDATKQSMTTSTTTNSRTGGSP